MNIIISGKDFKLSPSLKEFVTVHVEKISHKYPFIQEVKVELDVDHHQHSGDLFRAELSTVIGKRVAKAGEKSTDMHTAVNGALAKLTRQIEKIKNTRK